MAKKRDRERQRDGEGWRKIRFFKVYGHCLVQPINEFSYIQSYRSHYYGATHVYTTSFTPHRPSSHVYVQSRTHTSFLFLPLENPHKNSYRLWLIYMHIYCLHVYVNKTLYTQLIPSIYIYFCTYTYRSKYVYPSLFTGRLTNESEHLPATVQRMHHHHKHWLRAWGRAEINYRPH